MTNRHHTPWRVIAMVLLLAAFTAALTAEPYSLAEPADEPPQKTAAQEPPQSAPALPLVPLGAVLTPSASNFTTEAAKRATRRFNGIYEGDVIFGEITHYCRGRCCNGKWEGFAADGTVLDDDTPPIVGCNWLPINAVVEIDGQEYRVADNGGKGMNPVGRVDIYVHGSHADAEKLGRLHGVPVKVVSLP